MTAIVEGGAIVLFAVGALILLGVHPLEIVHQLRNWGKWRKDARRMSDKAMVTHIDDLRKRKAS